MLVIKRKKSCPNCGSDLILELSACTKSFSDLFYDVNVKAQCVKSSTCFQKTFAAPLHKLIVNANYMLSPKKTIKLEVHTDEEGYVLWTECTGKVFGRLSKGDFIGSYKILKVHSHYIVTDFSDGYKVVWDVKHTTSLRRTGGCGFTFTTYPTFWVNSVIGGVESV